MIHHEKRQFTNFLYGICSLNEESEYSLHHKFSEAITERDETCVNQLVEYISKYGNPFSTEDYDIQNLATVTQLDKKDSQFLLNVIAIGESAYAEFRKTRLEEKTAQIFDNIPKTRISTKLSTKKNKSDIIKETANFMRNINYARLRYYNIANLLKYGMTSTSFYLTKDDFLRKPTKSELATEVKKPLKEKILSELSKSPEKVMVVVDFMAYTRKIPVKTAKLKTYGDMETFVGHIY